MEYIHYKFPVITHIDDVLGYIDDKSFKVVEKDCGNTYINYVRMGPETFPPISGTLLERHTAAIRRECRGISFDTETGVITSRPFHKFFNVCENEYLTIPKMGFFMEHYIMDKVDGSMVRPVFTKEGLRWGTKMGITDTANFAETWVMDKPQYRKLALYGADAGVTPLFEYYSPENRVVVDYGARNMVLLAVRHNDSGEYYSYENVQNLAQSYGIDYVELHPGQVENPEEYIEKIKASMDIPEGVVIAWSNGHRSKIKTDAYNIKHRVKEAGRTERTLVRAVLNSEVDDLLSMLDEEDRREVDQFIRDLWMGMDVLEAKIKSLYDYSITSFDTKKDFAISNFGKALDQLARNCVFSLWDGKVEGPAEKAMQIIEGGLTSETAWGQMREKIEASTQLSGSLKFNWQGEDEE